MLIFADEGGRCIRQCLRQHLIFYKKSFFALERQKNIEKSLKNPKIINENLKISYFFQKIFKNSTTVLSSDKIQTGEIWQMTKKVLFAASTLLAAF